MVFFHASLLKTCVKAKLDSDLLFCVRAKMARRLYKIRDSDASRAVVDISHNAAQYAEAVLQDRWDGAQKKSQKTYNWFPDQLDFVSDTNIRLTNRYVIFSFFCAC
jgi:hypothetical protein